MRLFTIGGYGFSKDAFLAALKHAGVDTLVDIRQRRGMRGATYSFLNRRQLEESLVASGVRYVHATALAPTTEIRDAQKARDAALGQAKRDRIRLAPDFVTAYEQQVLARYTKEAFLESVGGGAVAVALFCVEGAPEACHRSLAAAHLSKLLATPVEHLRP